MLFKNTDYLKLKYFAFALERVFTCVNIFSHSADFFCHATLPTPTSSTCQSARLSRVIFIFGPKCWCFRQLSLDRASSYVFHMCPHLRMCVYVCVSERVRASWCCPPEWTPSRSHQLSMREHCKMTQRQSVWIKTEAVWGGGTKILKYNADVCIKTWIKTHTLQDDALLSFCTHFHRMTWLSFAAFFDSGFSYIPNQVKSSATQRDTTSSFNPLRARVAEYMYVCSNSWGEECLDSLLWLCLSNRRGED